MRPTPWQKREAPHEQVDSSGGVSRRRWDDARPRAVLGGKRLQSALGGKWGYLCAAVGCIITFVLLFQPWLTTDTGGTDGSIHVNAFGRLHVTTSLVELWAQSPPPASTVSGVWGILTSVAIVVVVCSVAVNSMVRTEALVRVATVATVLVAVFTIATVVHLRSRGDELTQMVSFGTARDPGTQVGLLLRWARGHGTYPVPGLRTVSWATASLTWYAFLAGAISLASAMAAVTQWMNGRKSRPHRQSLELSRSRSTISASPAPRTSSVWTGEPVRRRGIRSG